MNIAMVAKKFNISKDTLRYWEKIGLLPKINRNDAGYREYTEHDLNWVFYIQVLRQAGMTIERLLAFVTLYRQGNQTNKARKSLLVEQRQSLLNRITDIQKTLNYLDYKIEHFEDHALNYENEKLVYEKVATDKTNHSSANF